jgi:soluble lytic murein transglycosylase-like protein
MKATFLGGTMKSTLLAIMVAAYLLVGWLRPEAPKAIQIVGPSEAAIKEQTRNEIYARERQKDVSDVRRVLQSNGCSGQYADIIGSAALDNGLSPKLLAGLVVVESRGKSNADDGLGSIGLTQVNSGTWHYSKVRLRDPGTNVRAGAKILGQYIRAYGVVEGLHHYNGYSEVHEHVYVHKVLKAAGLEARWR